MPSASPSEVSTEHRGFGSGIGKMRDEALACHTWTLAMSDVVTNTVIVIQRNLWTTSDIWCQSDEVRGSALSDGGDPLC